MKAKPLYAVSGETRQGESRRLRAPCSLPWGAGVNGAARLQSEASALSLPLSLPSSLLSDSHSGAGKVRIAVKHVFFLKHTCDFIIKPT